MHDCPCCDEAVYNDDELECCSCCVEAGCEPNGEGVFDSCEIPSCPACETRATFTTSGTWSANCECVDEPHVNPG